MSKPYYPLSDDDFYLSRYAEEARGAVESITGKRADYGSSIGFHGYRGLMPRIADKFFRLNNLVWDGNENKFEGALDTARDLAAYALSMAVALEWELHNGDHRKASANRPDSC